MTFPEAESLARWLLEETERIPYGVVVVSLTIHDKQVRQIEKTVSIKERPVVEVGDPR